MTTGHCPLRTDADDNDVCDDDGDVDNGAGTNVIVSTKQYKTSITRVLVIYSNVLQDVQEENKTVTIHRKQQFKRTTWHTLSDTKMTN